MFVCATMLCAIRAAAGPDLVPVRLEALTDRSPCSGPLPESAHPYANLLNVSWTNTCPGARALQITFDERSQLEHVYDLLHITDANGRPVQGSPFSGDNLAGIIVAIAGDTVILRLETDGVFSEWGFAVTQLQALAAAASPAIVSREPFTIAWTGENQGTSTATNHFYDSIYISTNATWTSNVMLAAYGDLIEPVQPSGSYTQILTIRPNLAAGEYFVIVRIDSENLAAEDDDGNNGLAIPFRVKEPDLAAIALSAPPAAAAQETVAITWTVTNRSAHTCFPSWGDVIYLRQGSISNFVGWIWQDKPLPPSSTYTVTRHLMLPPAGPGLHYLEIHVNSVETTDSDPANNVLSVPITIENPDLVAVRATAPAQAAAGGNFQASFVISNAGPVTAYPGWQNWFYVSRTNRLTAEAAFVGSVYRDEGLAPGQATSDTANLYLPSGWAGDLFLLLQVDARTNLHNANFENDVVAVPFRVNAPDLVAVEFTADASVVARNEPISVSWTVENRGSVATSRNWYDAFLLARDSSGTSIVAVAGSEWEGVVVQNGGTYSRAATIAVPPATPGNYFLVFKTDAWGYQPEEIETNNTLSVPITIIDSELVPESLSAPALLAPHEPIEVRWSVRNRGPATAYPPWNDIFYIARTNNLSVPLHFLTQIPSTTALPVDAAYTSTQTLSGAYLPAGDYALVLNTRYPFYPSTNTNWITAAIRIEAPDLVALALSAPSTAVLGSTLEASLLVSNAGPVTAYPPWQVEFFASENPTVNNDGRRWLTSKAGSAPLAAGATAIITGEFTMASGFAESAYLIGRINPHGIYDSQPANNEAFAAISISGPDLVAEWTNVPNPWVVAAQQWIDLHWITRNAGGAAASALWRWSDNVWLKPAHDYWQTAFLASWFSVDSLAPGDSYQAFSEATLPSIRPGHYEIVVHADADSEVAETSETNNFAIIPIQVVSPDLAVVDFRAPSHVEGQSTVEVVWRVENRGPVTAFPSWSDRIFVAETNRLGPDDPSFFADYRYDALATNSSYTVTQLVTLPPLAGSNYYLIVRVDADNSLFDPIADNNEFAVPITISHPDLTPTHFSAARWGNSCAQPYAESPHPYPANADRWWTNACPGAAGLAIYFEDITHIQAGDELHIMDGDGRHVPGSPFQGFQGGLFYVPGDSVIFRLRSDAAGAGYGFVIQGIYPIFEETLPDLAPQSEVNLMFTVQNLGPAKAFSSWYDQVYFSTDALLDARDRLLADELWFSGSLHVGSSYFGLAGIRIPGAAAGDYFLIFTANGLTNLAEINHANNTLALPIRLSAVDIELAFLSGPAQASPNETIEVSWSVLNNGPASALQPWADEFYLSQDATWDELDIHLGRSSDNLSLEAGQGYSLTVNLQIPQLPPFGRAYLIARADTENKLADSNPANNVRTMPIDIILADLVAVSLTGAGGTSNLIASPQGQLDVEWRVHNAGPGVAAGYWVDRFYLSADPSWSSSDLELDFLQHNTTLEPGAEYEKSFSIYLDAVAAGEYYLLLRVDGWNDNYEANEDNNVVAVPITITEPADLRPVSLHAPASIIAHDRTPIIEVNWTITNQGAASASGQWFDRLYLSRDPIYDAEDYPLMFLERPQGLAPGESYTTADNVMLHLDGDGLYYLLLWTDQPGYCYEGCVFESDDENNIISVPIQIEFNLPDLVIAELSVPPLVVSSRDHVSFPVRWVVRNDGSGVAEGFWYDYLYLNGDWESSAFHSAPVLPSKSYTNQDFVTLSFPTNGLYSLTVRVDDPRNCDCVFESDETNNVRTVTFQFVRSPRNLVPADDFGSVALTFGTPTQASSVDLDFFVPPGKLTDVFASYGVAGLWSVITTPNGSGRYHVRFEMFPDQYLTGTQQISTITFKALSNQSSAFVPFSISNVVARTAQGAVIPGGTAHAERAVVIGPEPLLEGMRAAGGQHALTIYGLPGSNVVLETKSALTSGAWTNLWQGSLSNRFESLGPFPAPSTSRFYRARY